MHSFMFSTHHLIKRLIQLTITFTLACIIFSSLLSFPFQELFSLNLAFITHSFFWQPLTSLFLVPSPTISFSFLLDLAFSMLLLWMLGGQVLDFLGKKRFLFLYFGSALISALSALFVIHLTHDGKLVSCLPSTLLALATIWTMYGPTKNMLIFLFIPIPARWFLAIALFGTVVSTGMQRDYVHCAAYTSAFVFSYFLGIMKWHLHGPFEFLSRFEALLKRVSHAITIFWQWKVMSFFRTRRTVNREQEDLFIDSTLEKISEQGRVSLTWWENLRLRWISFKKR